MVHLHAHTTFSFLDGYGTPKQVADRLIKLGHKGIAITDHGNVVGHVPMWKEFTKRNLQLYMGCEFYVCDDMRQKGTHCPSIFGDMGKKPGPLPHITVLAATQEGYHNLLWLSKASYQIGYHYKPRIDLATLAEKSKGLIILSGCPGGIPTRLINQGKIEECYNLLGWMSRSFEAFAIEIPAQPEMREAIVAGHYLAQMGIALGVPCVTTGDCHFPEPTDHIYQDHLLCAGLRVKVNDPNRTLKLPDYQYICSEDELRLRLTKTVPSLTKDMIDAMMKNTDAVADYCNVELQSAEKLVYIGIEPGKTSKEHLLELAREGMIRVPYEYVDQYWDMALDEAQVLDEKNFCDYLLIVIDLVRFIRSLGCVVNMRGSATGCLLLYLTGASDIDPVEFGLSFERFYDRTRPDPPDIDLDFEKKYRDVAIRYVIERYGEENCSQIAGLSELKAKSAANDIAYVRGIPRAQYQHINDSMAADAPDAEVKSAFKAIDEVDPGFSDIVSGAIGQYRQTTIHAAGLLVSTRPIHEMVGVMTSTDGRLVSAVDKRGAALLGLLKLDLLSVESLDILGECMRSCDMPGKGEGKPPILSPGDMPLNDPRVFEKASSGDLSGIFQLDGASAKRVASEIGIDDFEDMVAASVLCRPGPIQFVDRYAKFKKHPEQFEEFLSQWSKPVANVLRKTKGIIMYQEQVMQLASIAGLSEVDVHKLRKGIGDKLGLDPVTGEAWRLEWSTKFIGGAIANGILEAEAQEIWKMISFHGGYSFNRAHAVSYAVIGYAMLYAKTYHPDIFYAASMSNQSNDAKLRRVAREYLSSGGRIELFAPESTNKFVVSSPSVIVASLDTLKGIGVKTAEKLSKAGPFKSVEETMSCMPKTVMNMYDWCRADYDHDPTRLIQFCSWFPIQSIPEIDKENSEKYGAYSCGLAASPSIDKWTKMIVSGYVTSLEAKPGKCNITIEDDKGELTCRTSKKDSAIISKEVAKLKVGDHICVSGSVNDGTLFFKEFALLRRSTYGK